MYTEKETAQANARLAKEALAHIRKTRKPSAVIKIDKLGCQYNSCAYGGIGCAFSVALRPGLPEHFEGKHAPFFIEDNPELLLEWARPCNASFAKEVQIAHDNLANQKGDAFVEAFESSLWQACAVYKVPYPEGA